MKLNGSTRMDSNNADMETSNDELATKKPNGNHVADNMKDPDIGLPNGVTNLKKVDSEKCSSIDNDNESERSPPTLEKESDSDEFMDCEDGLERSNGETKPDEGEAHDVDNDVEKGQCDSHDEIMDTDESPPKNLTNGNNMGDGDSSCDFKNLDASEQSKDHKSSDNEVTEESKSPVTKDIKGTPDKSANPSRAATPSTESGDNAASLSEEDVPLNSRLATSSPVVDSASTTPAQSRSATPKVGGSDSKMIVISSPESKKDVKDSESTTKKEETKLAEKAGTKEKVPRKRVVKKNVFDEQVTPKGGDGSENLRPMSKILYGIGLDLCREVTFKELIGIQERKKRKGVLEETELEQLDRLKQGHDQLVDKNNMYKLKQTKKCIACDFKTDVHLSLEDHLDYPHIVRYKHFCSFCEFSGATEAQWMFHMEAEHTRKGKIHPVEPANRCKYCDWTNANQYKMAQHKQGCAKKFNSSRNQVPAMMEFDIPLFMPPGGLKPLPAPPPPKVIAPSAPPRPIQQGVSLVRNAVANPQRFTTFSNASATGATVARPNILARQSQQVIYNPQNNTYFQPMQPYVLQVSTPSAPLLVSSPAPSLVSAGLRPVTPLVTPAQTATTLQVVNPSPTPTASQGLEVCEICGGFIKDRESLRVHFFWAHQVDIHKDLFNQRQAHLNCEHCNQRFWTFQGLTRHRQLSGHGKDGAPSAAATPAPIAKLNEPTMTCYICNRNKIPNRLFSKHLEQVHKISLLGMLQKCSCMVCGKKFTTPDLTKNHILMTHGAIFKVSDFDANVPCVDGKRIPCLPCNMSFPNMVTYSQHIASVHQKKCNMCTYTCSTMENLKKHTREAHGTYVKCQICKKSLLAGQEHNAHVQNKHLRTMKIKLKRLNSSDLRKWKRPRSHSDEPIVVEN
ncbi:unnamed protein product [Owenia fusiformis]|uniref:C2H2-type domain-containing protein n=1 Tax=Owenia fusiformis TaxID=6347 RepID=A0A8S4NGA5_OWEFU|nr:unnamed protein product [Owenia fusiformis]